MTEEEKDRKITALKCSKCSGQLSESYRIIEEDDEEEESIRIARCISCGTEYDQYTQEYYAYFADTFTYDKDATLFRLGLKGIINEKEYEIIGRLRYQEEDEEEVSVWDEWVAISSDGTYHYFNEESGKIISYEEYVPQSIDLDSDPSDIEFEGKRISKNTGYIGRIVYSEGELSWQPEIGEPVMCYDFKKNGNHFTIEQSEEEVSITRGERVNHGDIIEAFNLDEYREPYLRTINKRKLFKTKSRIYLLFFLVALIYTIFQANQSEKVATIPKSKTIVTLNELKTEKSDRFYFSQALIGPFEIPWDNSMYETRVFINPYVQRLSLEWQSFRMMLMKSDRLSSAVGGDFSGEKLKKVFTAIDAQKEPVESYVVIGDFWDEQGRDSDGYWHEQDITESTQFVLDEKGKYYFYLELYNQKPRNIESVQITIKKVHPVRYYIPIIAIFFILMLICKVRGRFYNELPFPVA